MSDFCHSSSLHPGRDGHSRTVDGFQANPHPGCLQAEN